MSSGSRGFLEVAAVGSCVFFLGYILYSYQQAPTRHSYSRLPGTDSTMSVSVQNTDNDCVDIELGNAAQCSGSSRKKSTEKKFSTSVARHSEVITKRHVPHPPSESTPPSKDSSSFLPRLQQRSFVEDFPRKSRESVSLPVIVDAKSNVEFNNFSVAGNNGSTEVSGIFKVDGARESENGVVQNNDLSLEVDTVGDETRSVGTEPEDDMEFADSQIPRVPKEVVVLQQHTVVGTELSGKPLVIWLPLPDLVDEVEGSTYDGIILPLQGAWQQCDEYWVETILTLEECINKQIEELTEASAALEPIQVERAGLAAKLDQKKTDIAVATEELNRADQRFSTLIRKNGAGHVRRSDSNLESINELVFPNGDAIVSEYKSLLHGFEEMAFEVVACLQSTDLSANENYGIVTKEVFLSIFNQTLAYVTDLKQKSQLQLKEEFGEEIQDTSGDSNVAWRFWLYAAQRTLPHKILSLSSEDVEELMNVMHPSVWKVQRFLAEGMRQGNVAKGIDLIYLIRGLLHLQVLGQLSDPYCHLAPPPCTRIPYCKATCVEILSPGTKHHGHIREGETVEVVMCGLYFENNCSSEKISQVPTDLVAPILVRRLL